MKVLKDSSDICNSILQDIWKTGYQERDIGKTVFPKFKHADVTPVYKKKDPALVANDQTVSVLTPCTYQGVKNNSFSENFAYLLNE